MSKKTIFKIVIDLLMTLTLLFLMTYNILGDAFHEWLGAEMLVLFLLHHILNFKWSRSISRGKYTAYRILQTVLLSVHLGLHWNSMMAMAKRVSGKSYAIRTWMLRILAFVVAGYGVWAFLNRDIGSYMTLRTQFVFFNYEEPLFLLLADYLAIMGLFVFVGHYMATAIRDLGEKQVRKTT